MIIHIPKKAQAQYIELRRAAEVADLKCSRLDSSTNHQSWTIALGMEAGYFKAIVDICGDTVAGEIVMAADRALCPELNLPRALSCTLFDAIGWQLTGRYKHGR